MKDVFILLDTIDSYKLRLASNHVISYDKVAFDALTNNLIKNY